MVLIPTLLFDTSTYKILLTFKLPATVVFFLIITLLETSKVFVIVVLPCEETPNLFNKFKLPEISTLPFEDISPVSELISTLLLTLILPDISNVPLAVVLPVDEFIINLFVLIVKFFDISNLPFEFILPLASITVNRSFCNL